jgi:hypothetical protein
MHRRITSHAVDRFIERVGARDRKEANARIHINVSRALTVPNRYAEDLWVVDYNPAATAPLRRRGIRYRFSPGVLFITRGKSVVTVVRTTPEDLATVLVWKMTNQWIGG